MVAEESRFDFCKQCGALARDGVCQSCGYVEAELAAPQPVQQPMAPQSVVQQPVTHQPAMQQPAAPQYAYYNYGAVPAAEPEKKKKNGALIAILISIVVLAFIALVILIVYAYGKYGGNGGRDDKDFKGESRKKAGYDEEYDDWEDDYDYDWEDNYEDDYDVSDEIDESDRDYSKLSYMHGSYDVTEDNWNEEGQDETKSFYSGPYNALKDDLSYEVSFTEEYYYSEETSSAVISIEYPQIVSGLEECRDYINAGCYYEYQYFEEFYTEEFAPLITSDEDSFLCMVDSYVTYMDEEMLSVVFVENVQMALAGEYYSGINMYCLNFDLVTGKVLFNTEVLRLDEDFVVKFRELETYENGEGHLIAYTDEEILTMLKDESQLVLFYTPMGMEVGLNLDDVVTYVMFDDYEAYLN